MPPAVTASVAPPTVPAAPRWGIPGRSSKKKLRPYKKHTTPNNTGHGGRRRGSGRESIAVQATTINWTRAMATAMTTLAIRRETSQSALFATMADRFLAETTCLIPRERRHAERMVVSSLSIPIPLLHRIHSLADLNHISVSCVLRRIIDWNLRQDRRAHPQES